MLISNVLEKTPAESAWELCANKLGDWVRTSWLDHSAQKARQWEDVLHEDPAALIGLREEGFGNIVGLDYILKWWGNVDSEAPAGQVDVIWKVMERGGLACYKTWIRLAERDFILALYREEPAKREANRKAFCDAFSQWKKLFEEVNGNAQASSHFAPFGVAPCVDLNICVCIR